MGDDDKTQLLQCVERLDDVIQRMRGWNEHPKFAANATVLECAKDDVMKVLERNWK